MKQQNRIAYISQGPAKGYIDLKKRFELVVDNKSSALFFHSFDENCNGCAFQANTTLAMGRNIALKEAIHSPLWDTFKYVVFFDDDLTLLDLQKAEKLYDFTQDVKPSGLEKSHPALIDESWNSFHRMLLDEKTNHPLIKPVDKLVDLKQEGITTTTYQSCVDDNFWAIRKDHVDFLYPYSTLQVTGRRKNHHLNGQATFVKMEKCYPAGFKVDYRFLVENPQHRYLPALYNSQQIVSEILNETYPMLGPWDVDPLVKGMRGCTIKKTPSTGVHPECKQASEERFRRWVKGEFEP